MSSSEDGNIKNLKCEFCPIVFSNIDDLANHLVNGHANDFKIEPEDYLEIEANAENQVQRNQEDRNCQFCGKSFSRRDHKKNHIKRIHEEGQIYNNKCEFCGKSFAQPAHLRTHTYS